MTVPINDVNFIYGVCTMCEERGEEANIHANRGDVIIIYPQWLMGKYELIVLCEKHYLELKEEE